MTADDNAAIVRRGYAAFNSGDVNTLSELFDENAVWHAPGRSSLAGDYQGRDATLGYLGRLGQETGGNFRAELLHLTADDEDCVVGLCCDPILTQLIGPLVLEGFRILVIEQDATDDLSAVGHVLAYIPA